MTEREKIIDIARVKCENIRNNSKRRRAFRAVVKMLEKKFAEAL